MQLHAIDEAGNHMLIQGPLTRFITNRYDLCSYYVRQFDRGCCFTTQKEKKINLVISTHVVTVHLEKNKFYLVPIENQIFRSQTL